MMNNTKKMLLSIMCLFLMLLTLGCGMSKDEKQKDLEHKIVALKIALEMYLVPNYYGFINNYTDKALPSNEKSEVNKQIQGAEKSLEDLNKINLMFHGSKAIKLDDNNDDEKKKEFDAICKDYDNAQIKLQEMIKIKMMLMKKILENNPKLTQNEKTQGEKLKLLLKEYNQSMNSGDMKLKNMVKKYNISLHGM